MNGLSGTHAIITGRPDCTVLKIAAMSDLELLQFENFNHRKWPGKGLERTELDEETFGTK